MLKRFFLILSIIVFISGVFYFLNLYLKKNIKNTNLYGKVTTKDDIESFVFRKVERDKDRWRRDPFNQKEVVKKEAFKTSFDEEINVNIEAIVTGDKNYAIINGKIIKAGDKIGDYKIETIQKHKVIFKKNGIKKEVYIY